jgi:myo-inositol-1(or 4)-monophosphatase
MQQQSKEKLIEAVQQAGDKLLALWPGTACESTLLEVRKKADGSLVSHADMESNAILLHALNRIFPGDAILSEEVPFDSTLLARTERIWIIDPLDGTTSFVHGRDDFSILVALVEHSVPVFGIMYFPARKILAVAEQGHPALCNGKEIHVSTERELKPGRVYLRNLERQHPELCAPSMDSGLAFLKLACGELDGIAIRMTTHRDWDIAAPMAVLFSAGGCATNETGDAVRLAKGDLADTHVLASNGLIHKQLQGLI